MEKVDYLFKHSANFSYREKKLKVMHPLNITKKSVLQGHNKATILLRMTIYVKGIKTSQHKTKIINKSWLIIVYRKTN